MVKVKDLIKELRKLDQEKEVTLWNFDTCCYDSIEIRVQDSSDSSDYEVIERKEISSN
jgi:hypothetical protein